MAFGSVKRVKLREGALLNFALTLGRRNGEDERLNILQWKDEEDEKFTPGGVNRREKESRESDLRHGLAQVLALYIQPSSSAYRDFRLDITVTLLRPATLYACVYRCM